MTVKTGDTACIAGHPDRGERDHLVVLVLGPNLGNEDGDTVDVFSPDRGEVLRNLPVYPSRQALEDASSQAQLDLTNAQGASHPLKMDNGRNREATFHDVLPWANGVYPIPSDVDSADQAAEDGGAGDGSDSEQGHKTPAKKTTSARR